MKSSVDIHIYLSTVEDMEDWHADAQEASDALNDILHLMYDKADIDINTDTLIKKLETVWETWHKHPDLTYIDTEDFSNWVDQELNT
ncbi:MAG: hypothetical protein AAGJ37_11545 [Pseudomonadota bacterium]